MARVLEGAGVAALHVDTGRYEECLQAIATIYPKPGHKLDVQHAIKEAANVLVIGGSPADVAAAITARRRGYYVELWEKEDRQGDNLWAAGGPVFKTDILKLIRYQVLQGNKLGVKLCLNRSADEHNVCGGIWDKVIPAAGASPALPPIKGVVITGGGLAGTEAACDIAATAESVTILEMLPDILLASEGCPNSGQHLRTMAGNRDIHVMVGATVGEIGPSGVTSTKGMARSIRLPVTLCSMLLAFGRATSSRMCLRMPMMTCPSWEMLSARARSLMPFTRDATPSALWGNLLSDAAGGLDA